MYVTYIWSSIILGFRHLYIETSDYISPRNEERCVFITCLAYYDAYLFLLDGWLRSVHVIHNTFTLNTNMALRSM